MEHKKKILIVEDEKVIALYTKKSVESFGYKCVGIVDNGEEAIEKALELRPDLILMDIMILGNLTGIEAARKIKEKVSVPIIYLTAYTNESIIQEAKITEPYGYIVKPYELRELKIVLEIAFYKFKVDKEVKANREWLKTVLKEIGEGIIITDEEGIIRFLNVTACKLTGWELNDAIGKSIKEVFNIANEKSGKSYSFLIDEALENKKLSNVRDVLLLSKKGEKYNIDPMFNYVADEENTYGLVCLFKDITERKKEDSLLMEMQLNKQKWISNLKLLKNSKLNKK